MADESQAGAVKVPGLKPVQYVVVKLADGRVVLRHPDELEKSKPATGETPVPR
jgi:hypothetical protein